MLLQKHNPNWETDFNKIKTILAEALGDSILNIEHVGSTSIPDLKAKPIIDIDLVYTSEVDFNAIKSNLESIGYYHNGDQGIEGREVFKRTTDQNHEILDSITHHLYGCHKDAEELKKHLLFRNHLRVNESAKNQYEKVKLELAIKANQHKKRYAILKEQEATQFVQDCIKKEIENGK